LFARSAQSDFMQDGDVVFYDGRLADDDARAVIDQDARADPRRRMDIDAKGLRDAVLEMGGQRFPSPPPKPVGDPVRLQRVKPLVIEKGLHVAMGGWVARSRR